MFEIFSTSIPFFIIIGIGAGVSPFIDKDKWIEVLNKYGLYIGFPAIIISSLIKLKDNFNFGFIVVIANLIILLISIAIILLITKLSKVDRDTRNAYIICGFFGNVAYLGFPFISSLFPNSDGLISVIIAVYIFIVFTVGVSILDISRNNKSINFLVLLQNLLKNPLLLSVFIGIAIVALGITIPPVLQKPIEMLSASGSPIVLLSLGIFISRKIQFNKNLLHATIISIYKLIALPIFFLLILQFFQLSKNEVSISVIEAAMPLAITPFALAEIYPLDKEIVAMSIIISTVLSLFSLALITFLVQ